MLENAAAESLAETAPGRECAAFGDPPVDLVHLARQCQGDARLEEELLGLFRLLSRSLVAQVSNAQMPLELKANVAHKLRGSALAIGAGRVARAAEAIEEMGRAARPDDAPVGDPVEKVSLAVAALQEAASEAIAQIDRLLP